MAIEFPTGRGNLANHLSSLFHITSGETRAQGERGNLPSWFVEESPIISHVNVQSIAISLSSWILKGLTGHINTYIRRLCSMYLATLKDKFSVGIEMAPGKHSKFTEGNKMPHITDLMLLTKTAWDKALNGHLPMNINADLSCCTITWQEQTGKFLNQSLH